MDLKDATLMFLIEAADFPAVAELAERAYSELIDFGSVDYRLLNDMVGEASGKGMLRVLNVKYSKVTYDAIVMPVLQEIGRQKPIGSTRHTWRPSDGDPLTAGLRH